MDRAADALGLSPLTWFVVFHTETSYRWLDALPGLGRFRHVSAFGYCVAAQAWVHYSAGAFRSCITVIPGSTAQMAIDVIASDHMVLKVKPWGSMRPKWPRLWCVPDIAGLVGCETSAFTPDGLYRDCLAHGAEVVE